MSEALADLTLHEAAALLARREASSREITAACLCRIERLQPTLNAFLRIKAESALAAADAADERRRRDRSRGPLDGIPVAHKDLLDSAGRVTTAGGIMLEDRSATATATVLERLDDAGAVETGTLNLSEFAAGATGHNRHHGDCRNPWDPKRIPGGSSSGSAAAVAGRLVFASLGTDTGGSIRLPAHFCGVVGLRPTQGRVSTLGAFPRSWAMDTVGPIARTALDAALVFDAIADPEPEWPPGRTAEDWRALLEEPVRGLRVGVPENWFFAEVSDDIRSLLEAALRVIEELGGTVVPVAVPDPELAFRLAQIVAKAEAASIHERWIRERPDDYDHGIREEMDTGFFIPAVDYLHALRSRGGALDRWLEGPLSGADLLFTPVMDDPTPLLAECAPRTPEAAATVMARFGRCTRPVSYLGLPALSVPCGFQEDGMPAAFQLIGRPRDEISLFRLGHAYQAAAGWHEIRPRCCDAG